MAPKKTRRDFLRKGAVATAGLVAAGTAPTARAADQPEKHEHDHEDFPRDHPGVGGPVGSATDRGKLVAGYRAAGQPPVPVEMPDLPKLPWKMVGGVKEFHLVPQVVRRELLANQFFYVWGFNGTMPGPLIEAVEGDRVRIVVHNELPEATTVHWHGLELPNRMDGVPGLTQDPIMPGKDFTYEFDLHQNGTFFYHSHGPMQEVMGMSGLFVIHPRSAYNPPVDHDFGIIMQEFAILPQSDIPNSLSEEFNFFTINGRSGPYLTPLIVKLGSRVRIRMMNMSAMDHHPMHLHGHTFWITGTEGGRIPESAWVPSNNVLVRVGQSRDVEFIANNPGDWVLHCHILHHMMNHMVSMVAMPEMMHGRMAMQGRGMPVGNDFAAGSGRPNGGPALSAENGPSLGRGLGPGTANERGLTTMPQMGLDRDDPRYKVPGFPQDMLEMKEMMIAQRDLPKYRQPATRGMRRNWYTGVEAMMTVVRVLPPDLYDKVVSGKGDVPDGASVPGGGAGQMPGMQHMHDMKMPRP